MCERDAYVEPEHLSSSGFEPGASNPALYRSELVSGFCYGDDFVTAAAEDQIESFGRLLQEKFYTRRIGMNGAAEHLDKELELLHRSVRVINEELMKIEADQRHIPRLLENLGFIRCNIVKTSRVKLSIYGGRCNREQSNYRRRASNVVSEWDHAMCISGTRPCGHF